MFGDYQEKFTIGELVTINRGASPRPIDKYLTKENGINWIKIGDANENDIYITHAKEMITPDGANKSRSVKKGDFILSNSMSFGRPYILNIDGCVHDGWLIISDYNYYFKSLFLYYLLRSEKIQSQFNGSANGSCVKNLNSDIVKKIKVITPSITLQNKFASFVEQIDKLKFVGHSRYRLCEIFTFASSTIAYSRVVSIFVCPSRC